MPEAEWCWNHHPDYAEARRRRAQKGGKRGGRGRPTSELARLQGRFEDLAEKVLSGEVERGVGAVAGQPLNGARACVRDSLTAREQEELVERLEALESALEQRKGGSRWGSLNRWVKRLSEDLGMPESEAKQEEERRKAETRKRIIAELERVESRRRSRSDAEHKAWLASEEGQAEKRALEEAIARKRGGGT